MQFDVRCLLCFNVHKLNTLPQTYNPADLAQHFFLETQTQVENLHQDREPKLLHTCVPTDGWFSGVGGEGGTDCGGRHTRGAAGARWRLQEAGSEAAHGGGRARRGRRAGRRESGTKYMLMTCPEQHRQNTF